MIQIITSLASNQFSAFLSRPNLSESFRYPLHPLKVDAYKKSKIYQYYCCTYIEVNHFRVVSSLFDLVYLPPFLFSAASLTEFHIIRFDPPDTMCTIPVWLTVSPFLFSFLFYCSYLRRFAHIIFILPICELI